MSAAASSHPHPPAPSAWVRRFLPLVEPGGTILDLACGGGRHARLFAQEGFRVEAVDRDADALATLQGVSGVTTRQADLEDDAHWPLAGRQFDAVVVTNYLHRPHFADLLACVGPAGVLIYETFMLGNERLGRPASPEFLLRPAELLERVGDEFTVIAFEQGRVESPKAAVVQRICAVRRRADSVHLPVG